MVINISKGGKEVAGKTTVSELSEKAIPVVYGKVSKAYLACDTGAAIKGNRIDIYMENYDEAINFGRQKVRVRVIK